MAHIDNAGYAVVDSDPNTITELQSGHGIKKAVHTDGREWNFVDTNTAGSKWELQGGASSLDELSDATRDGNGIFLSVGEPDYTGGETRGTDNFVALDAARDGIGSDNIMIGVGAGSGIGNNGGNGNNRNLMLGKNAGGDAYFAEDNIILGDNAATSMRTGQRNIIIGSNVDVDNPTDDDRLNIGGLIKGRFDESKVSLNDAEYDETFNVKGGVSLESTDEEFKVNEGIASFYKAAPVANEIMHIKLPYTVADLANWCIKVKGGSGSSNTAIDLMFYGTIFFSNGLRNLSHTIEHNNPNPALGVMDSGTYISPVDGFVTLWFRLSNSGATRFSVDSWLASAVDILKSGDVSITASINAQI